MTCLRSLVPLLLLFVQLSQSYCQRQLMSIHTPAAINQHSDIYCVSLVNNWTGTFEIVVPDYQSVDKLLVEAYFEADPDAKRLPKETVTFAGQYEEIEVSLPKKERLNGNKKEYFVYRTVLHQLTPSVVMKSPHSIGPVAFRLTAKRIHPEKIEDLAASESSSR